MSERSLSSTVILQMLISSGLGAVGSRSGSKSGLMQARRWTRFVFNSLLQFYVEKLATDR